MERIGKLLFVLGLTAAPISALAQVVTQNDFVITVDAARQIPVLTGISVQAGRTLTFTASGTWCMGGTPPTAECGPPSGIRPANAEELPFPDNSFDAYTIAFGIRNVPRIDVALAEAFRVLKTGGRFMCLEFSEVEMPLLDRFYDAWSFNAIPAIGKAVTGDGDSYRYLVESIRKFPRQEEFAAMIRKAGFSRVSYRNYSGGIAAAHSGWKL